METIKYWNKSSSPFPSRSLLFDLEPIRTRTSWTESLTSYFIRLAQAHCVTVRTLFVEMILPLFGRSYLANSEYHSLSTFWEKNCRALNGIGSLASDWVDVLQSLTLRSDLFGLTMLMWAEVLPAKGLLRNCQAWCPDCLVEWHRTSTNIYVPLLWMLQPVTICPHHHQRLYVVCSSCKKHQPFLSSKIQPGYCIYCHTWLGTVSDEQLDRTKVVSEEEYVWQNWIVDNLGEMIAVAPTLTSLPHKEWIADSVSSCVMQISNGNASAFARQLQDLNVQVSKWSVWDWQRGGQLPQLGILLQMCYCFGIRPLDFVLGKTFMIKSIQSFPFESKSDEKVISTNKPFNKTRLKNDLGAALLERREAPPSLAKVANKIGHDQSHLATLFPEESQEISKTYRTYQHAQSIKRKENVRREVRQVALKLDSEGRYPSMRQVRNLLSDPNLMRLPEAQDEWRLVIDELGWQKGGK